MRHTNLRARRSKAVLAAACLVLTACAVDTERLSGERESLGLAAVDESEASIANEALPIALPAQQAFAEWTHPGSNALHRSGHAAFSTAPSLIWSSNIGQRSTRRNRINATPVVADGRVFTVDANGVVAATSTSGARLWSRNFTPPAERAGQGASHGLAYGGGALYVNTGYGEVTAVDPATGGEIWSQDLDAQGGGSATYLDGRVYVAASDNIGWALDATSGRVDWQIFGNPSGAGYLGGAGPVLTDDLAIFPFSSGEIEAVFRRGGLPRWTSTVLGGRQGVAYAQIVDLAADAVAAGNRLYVANPAGRLVALDLDDGSRIWTAREGSISTPVVAGGSVFVVTDQNALMRLDADTGTRIWSIDLPLFEERRFRRDRSVFSHKGPVLAGGRLWLASTDGLLRGFDPVSGALTITLPINRGAASAPVVVGGTMYVVTNRGELLAFR